MANQDVTGDGDMQEPREQAETQRADAAYQKKEEADARQPDNELDFPVVGVGASAGGLQSFEALLRHLPADSGMAIIFVQHLSPDHPSNLTDILPRSTKMPVRQAGDGMRIERDHVYVIPPDRELAVMNGALHLMSRPQTPARHMPIDYLFRSLAEDQRNRAVAVVLSGTGSDGAAGLRAIKAEGGLTLAEDEESARYSGMPHAAVATGQVDLVLPPSAIAKELGRIVRHPHIRGKAAPKEPDGLGAPEAIQKIFILIRHATGVDFSQYKQSTVERRIARRMIYDLGDGQWDHPEFRRLLEQIIPENTEFRGFAIVQDFPHIGRKRAVLDAQRIDQEGQRPRLVLLSVRELNDL